MSGIGGVKNDSSDLEDDMDWIDVDDESTVDADEIHVEAQSDDGDPDNETSSNSKPAKKKKSSLLPFLLLLAAGGGGWYYLYSSGVLQTADSAKTTDTPVVAIEPEVVPPAEQTLAASSPDASATITQDPIVIPPDAQTSQLLPVDQLAPAPEQNADAGVLTPLPDTAVLSQTVLPPLEDTSVTAAQNAVTELAQLQQPVIEAAPSDETTGLLPTTALDQIPPAQIAESSEAKLLEETEKKPNDLMALKAEAPVEAEIPVPLPLELMPDSATAVVSGIVDVPKTDSAEIASPSTVSPDKIAELTPEQPKPVEPTIAVIPELTPPAATDVNTKPVEEIKTPDAPLTVEVKKEEKPAVSEVKAPKSAPSVVAEAKKPETKPVSTKTDTTKIDTSRTVAKEEPPKQEVLPKKTVIVNWTLRSAQPGAAVLYDPSTGNMKSVEIGDRIEGIGKIKSIATENGKWVVRGSSGKVSQ